MNGPEVVRIVAAFLAGYLAHKWRPHKRQNEVWRPTNVRIKKLI